MKFWQRIFFSSLIIFIVIFDVGAYVITSYSYNFSLEREKKSAFREHNVILSSVKNGIDNVEKIYSGASKNSQNLFAVIEALGAYYAPQGVRLMLYYNTKEVYESIHISDLNLLKFENNAKTNMTDQKIRENPTEDGKRYLFIATKIPNYEHLTFVYARDINGIDLYRKEISKVFILLNIVVCIVMGISIFLLLKRMTRPISILNKVTSEIANGNYDKRVDVRRKDEIGELSETFNKMANSVEHHMKELTQAGEEKQRFIDNLSHEIKTPLTSILGYSEFLQNAKCGEEERIVAAGHLHNSAQRLNNLSGKLLDITFLRKEEVKKNQVDITILFDALSDQMKIILFERELNLKTDIQTKYISGDETLLLSLLINLVENASRASENNSTITVKAYEENCTVIEVSDKGFGMDGDEIKKISEPFYRVDKSRSQSFGGVGLGLSICKQIIDLHGAKWEITSKPNEGTTVKVYFTTS